MQDPAGQVAAARHGQLSLPDNIVQGQERPCAIHFSAKPSLTIAVWEVPPISIKRTPPNLGNFWRSYGQPCVATAAHSCQLLTELTNSHVQLPK